MKVDIHRLRRWAALALLGVAALSSGLAAAQGSFTRHGTWWNPAEPGTGFFFEAQGGQAIATFFVYDDEGALIWYSAPGSFTATAGGHRFQGELLQFADGPVIHDPDSAPAPIAAPAGAVTITFTGANAQVQLPRRTFQAEKYATRPPALRNGANGVIPETGIYWDPKGSGRGFTIEADGDTVTMGIYAFTSQGYPTWRLAVYPLEAAPVTVRPTVFEGGQTLDGAWKAPTGTPASASYDEVTVSFETPCFAAISLSGTMSLERFGFGGTACRSASATAPSPRKMLPPDLAADTLLTSAQVRTAAARMAWFIDTLPLHDIQAREMIRAGREIAPGAISSMSCGGVGSIYAEREDPDNDKLLSIGDVVWFQFAECRLPAFAGIPEYFYKGWIRSTLESQSTEAFTSRLRYYWLDAYSKRDDVWYNGGVQVAGYLEYWFSTYKFDGFVIEATEFLGPRIGVRSGTARRIAGNSFFELRFEDLDMRLSLGATTRLQARARLLDAGRPLLYDFETLAVVDSAQQGTLVLDLEPGRADGHQIHLRPDGADTFEIQYRRGATVLSSQRATRTELSDAGRL